MPLWNVRQSDSRRRQRLDSVRFGISRSQAYRYVRKQAERKDGGSRPKIAFTIKLSQDLFREFGDTGSTGKTLSEVVTQALESFLRGIQRRG